MKISLDGLINQSAQSLQKGRTRFGAGYAHELQQLAKNLHELAERHRKGDGKAIEEFIALYDLEPAGTPAGAPRPEQTGLPLPCVETTPTASVSTKLAPSAAELAAAKLAVAALVQISEHDAKEKNGYVDEWEEARSYSECKDIAKAALVEGTALIEGAVAK